MALDKGQKRIGQRPRKNWPKAKIALAEGQSPPQELEVSPRRGLYFLVLYIYVFNSLLKDIIYCIIYPIKQISQGLARMGCPGPRDLHFGPTNLLFLVLKYKFILE